VPDIAQLAPLADAVGEGQSNAFPSRMGAILTDRIELETAIYR